MVRALAALLASLALFSTSTAEASVIGSWNGSARSWNSGDMATLKATMILAGHIVEADEAISAANLANNSHFVIGEPSSSPTAGELTALSSWVSGGGILMLFADSGGSGLPALNNIAVGISSALNWSGSISSTPLIVGGNFASEGPPYNIVGQSLATSPGTPVVSGGTQLAGDYIRYEAIGSGWVFGFADRSDHNVFAPTDSNTNGQLFLNIVNGPSASAVPEPATLAIVAMSLSTLGTFRLLRRKRAE